jgi:L-seryl-tRNA(Ser) seleniumtransferase
MNDDKQNKLKALPAVDTVLKTSTATDLIDKYGRSSTVAAIRTAIKTARDNTLAEKIQDLSEDSIAGMATDILASEMKPRLSRAVNASGIILHTGLGRAHMPDAARNALSELTGFCNVQMDLPTGNRIQREACIKELIHDLTGAEDAVLVNNNAGGTMLALKALAENKEVIVSRGELIEIGGSFRLPEIMEQSGAVLHEVGSTNKTHLKDYQKAINDKTALLLKAHKSNYCIVGFTKEVTIHEIAALGKEHKVTVADDLGCGALIDLEQFGLEHEMTVKESLDAGSDIVLFSTDKLIGGPQGGLIVGRKDLIETIRSNPLYRALRVGKMTLAALEATLRLFKTPEKLTEHHPVYRMLAKTPEIMQKQANDLAELIRPKQPEWDITVAEEPSHLGGGSLPTSSLPAFAVKIKSDNISADAIAQQLRTATIPVVPHISDNAVIINMRTVFTEQFEDILNACTTT